MPPCTACKALASPCMAIIVPNHGRRHAGPAHAPRIGTNLASVQYSARVSPSNGSEASTEAAELLPMKAKHSGKHTIAQPAAAASCAQSTSLRLAACSTVASGTARRAHWLCAVTDLQYLGRSLTTEEASQQRDGPARSCDSCIAAAVATRRARECIAGCRGLHLDLLAACGQVGGLVGARTQLADSDPWHLCCGLGRGAEHAKRSQHQASLQASAKR